VITFEIKQPGFIQWRDITGKLHRTGGPAYTGWYANGQKSYEGCGPAYTGWHSNGQKSNEEHWESGKQTVKLDLHKV